MKKHFTLVSVFLIISLLLAACNSSNESGGKDNSKEGSNKEENNIKLTAPGTFPITEEKVTLRVLIPSNHMVEDFETNEFTKWYEEKTNVHIEWEIMPSQNAEEKLNLTLASGDLPDIIMDSPVTLSQLMIYGSRGMFLPLNQYIEEQGTVMNEFFEERPEFKDIITAPDGNIYSLPKLNECYHCTYGQKVFIYKPWLDQLGLDVPETTEEFYTVLKAFKENDLNGNGKNDEIPYAGSKDLWPLPNFFMNAFSFDTIYMEDGKVQAPWDKPEWKEGLKYLNKLYSEGLIAKETITQTADELKRNGNSSEVILGAAPGYYQGDFMQTGGNEGRWMDYVAIPPLKGPSGKQDARYLAPIPLRASFIVTNASKYPEVAVRWAEGFYDEEVILRAESGLPDKDWRWAEDGEVAINGEKATWARIASYGDVQNTHWATTGPLIRTNDFRLGEVASEDQPLEQILYNETKEKYEPYKPDDSQILPPLYYNEEQAMEMSEIEATITSFVEESSARFISGDDDIEKGWNNYLKTLESMNLKRLIEIYQEAYDAKYNK